MVKKYCLVFLLGAMLVSCNEKEGETIETAYIDPLTLPQVYKYSFSRNGTSSVDILECNLVKEPLDLVYSKLRRASFFGEEDYNQAVNYYKQGLYNIKPAEQVANSVLHQNNKSNIENDILKIIETSAKIAGYEVGKPYVPGRYEAKKGSLGYVGFSLSDPNLVYVDEKGVVISEVFQAIVQGAIYLDKVLNYHLNETFLDDPIRRKNHENVSLVVGHNYTELEHHWDLAYGYYGFLRGFTQLHGISLIKDSQRKLFEAFVQGRIELSRYRYDVMKTHLHIIRRELSRVVAVCAMHYLVGNNTLANLKETPQDAFLFLSKGYGLIYALQFTCNEAGNPYFSYAEIQQILSQLTEGNGFWDKNRLLGDESTQGSLKNIASRIGKPFNVSLDDLKR